MRNVFLALLLVSFLLVSFSGASELLYGKLTVIADDDLAQIYIDGKLAGNSMAEIDRIMAGTHYVKIWQGQGKVFEKIVTIEPGKQTTVVAEAAPGRSKQAEPAQERSKQAWLFDASYGGYSADVSYGGQSYSGSIPGSPIGLGVGYKNYFSDDLGIYYTAGLNYTTKAETDQISNINVNLGTESGSMFAEAGVNYPVWKNDYLSIQGVMGYQVAAGIKLAENMAAGIKYEVLKGSYSLGNYYGSNSSGNVTFNRPIVYVRIQ